MSLTRTKPTANGHHKDRSVAKHELRLERAPRSHPMTLTYLSIAAGFLGSVSSVTGLLWRGGGDAVSFLTAQGEVTELLGRGLYEHDTLFVAGNNFASDLVMLLVTLPLLVVSLRMHGRGSIRGSLLLLGTLGFMLYYGASYALGAVAFNELFLVYVAMFSASLFSVIVAFTSFDLQGLADRLDPSMPRRGPGAFMIASGVVTLAVWMMEPVGSLVSGDPPGTLDTHTTLFTNAFDMAIIVPAALIAGTLILRRRALGYLVAFSLLITEISLLPLIGIATIRQVQMGLTFTPEELVGPISGFAVFSLISIWMLMWLLKNISESPRYLEVSSS